MPIEATWMDLEIIMLSEVRQIKTGIGLFCFYVACKKEREGQGRLACWSMESQSVGHSN